MLLLWHLGAQNWKNTSTYTKNKTWIFMLLFLFEFTVVIRYTFQMYELSVYLPMLVVT